MVKKILHFLLAFNLFFLQAYLIRFSFTNLQELLILVNLFVLLWVMDFRDFLKALFRHRILLSFLGLSFLAFVSLPLPDVLTALRFVKFLFFGSLLSFIFLETYKTQEARLQGVRILSYGALAFGVFSLIYNLLGFNVMLDHRLAGPLDSAVYLAFYLVPALLFFAFDGFSNPKNFRKWIPFVLTGGLLLGTRSFGAVGGAFLVLILYMLKQVKFAFVKTLWFKALAVSLGALFLAGVFYIKILPTLQTDYSSLDERGEIWETSFAILKDPQAFVFGVGLGQFQIHYEQNVAEVLGREPLDYYVLQPHNFFLLFMMNYGLLGLGLIVYLMGLTVWYILKNQPGGKVEEFALYVLLYFFIHGLIDTPFFKNDLLFLLFLFLELGLGAKVYRLQR